MPSSNSIERVRDLSPGPLFYFDSKGKLVKWLWLYHTECGASDVLGRLSHFLVDRIVHHNGVCHGLCREG